MVVPLLVLITLLVRMLLMSIARQLSVLLFLLCALLVVLSLQRVLLSFLPSLLSVLTARVCTPGLFLFFLFAP